VAPEVDPRAPTRTSRPREDAPGPRTGEQIGRYVVERTLGAGGMGVVVEARDPELQRQVAVKLVRADIGDRAYRLRLVREARAQASLDHPNVVRVYDAGEADGELFIAMELVAGRSLGAWLRAVPRPWRAVLARFVAAGHGLAAAHAAGMVHRDFKPDNVLVRDSDERVLVTDFGLAISAGREARGTPGAVAIEPSSGDEPTIDGGSASDDAGSIPPVTGTYAVTATGVALGTPPYMAPEQHAGGAVDARADVFSFCVSLYEGVYGERPFAVEDARRYDPLAWVDAIHDRGVRPAPAGRRVPAALRRALVRGLAADPEARWPSMQALIAALDSVLARRRRVLYALAGLGAATAIAVATFAATRSTASAPIDRCADEAARVDRTWGADARARVSRGLLATGKPYAQVAASRVTDAIDRWSVQWRDVRTSSCHDADRGALAANDWRAVSACLDEGLADLGSRIDLLADGARSIDHIGDLIEMRPPSSCTRVGLEAPPEDPTIAAKVAAARAELRAIDRLDDLGREVEVAPRARRLLAHARALGWRPLIDDVAYTLAWADLELTQPTEAEPLLREVAQSAGARGDDVLAGRASTALLVLMKDTHRFDGLDFVANAARASVQRSHNPRGILVVDSHVGRAYIAAGRVADAKKLCESSLGKVDATMSGYGVRAELLQCLALVAQSERRLDDQLRYAGLILGERLRLLGPGHPAVADTLMQIGIVMGELGRVHDALVLELAAQAAFDQAQGSDSVSSALTWAQIARLRVQLHDAAGARAAIDRASAIAEHATTDGDPQRDQILRDRAEVLGGIGDVDGALAAVKEVAARVERLHPGTVEDFASTFMYAQALEDVHKCAEAVPILDRALPRLAGVAPPQRLMMWMVKGNCQLELGHAGDVAPELDAAWASIDPSTIDVPDRAMMTYTLARVFEKAGDRRRALAFALDSRKGIYATEGLADYRESIDNIVQRLGGGPPPHASSSPPH
jgi:hypothetical protein